MAEEFPYFNQVVKWVCGEYNVPLKAADQKIGEEVGVSPRTAKSWRVERPAAMGEGDARKASKALARICMDRENEACGKPMPPSEARGFESELAGQLLDWMRSGLPDGNDAIKIPKPTTKYAAIGAALSLLDSNKTLRILSISDKVIEAVEGVLRVDIADNGEEKDERAVLEMLGSLKNRGEAPEVILQQSAKEHLRRTEKIKEDRLNLSGYLSERRRKLDQMN